MYKGIGGGGRKRRDYLSKRAEEEAARAKRERKKAREAVGGEPEAGVEGGTAQRMVRDLLPYTGSFAKQDDDVKGEEIQPVEQSEEEQYSTSPPSPVGEHVVL